MHKMPLRFGRKAKNWLARRFSKQAPEDRRCGSCRDIDENWLFIGSNQDPVNSPIFLPVATRNQRIGWRVSVPPVASLRGKITAQGPERHRSVARQFGAPSARDAAYLRAFARPPLLMSQSRCRSIALLPYSWWVSFENPSQKFTQIGYSIFHGR